MAITIVDDKISDERENIGVTRYLLEHAHRNNQQSIWSSAILITHDI